MQKLTANDKQPIQLTQAPTQTQPVASFSQEEATNVVKLTQKLIGLGIDAAFDSIENGPVVTTYLFTLGNSVPIQRILKRSEDFALSLGVDKVIVQRIGNKIALFVPNDKREVVDFKDYLHWFLNDPAVKEMKLPIPLGVDYHGTKSAFDLCDMPHILCTGSTNSGKSVYEAAIISCLVYMLSSSDFHLYLVDTKRLDLPLFKTLPHVRDCADDLDKFHNMMYTLMAETRRRLGVLQGAGCRNIHDYHVMMGDKSVMPYIILMLDEFGDLKITDLQNRKADKEKYEGTPTVTGWLLSLAQISRAAGVHIIACTQRASVKIIDGDIKTNLPCRIALRLPTGVDSKTVLDTNGAENLLGKGDMLIKRTDSDTIDRYHGPYVSMSDIQQLVVNYEQIRSMFVK